jgi:hypothetical protein
MRTDRHDGANSRFSQFCERALRMCNLLGLWCELQDVRVGHNRGRVFFFRYTSFFLSREVSVANVDPGPSAVTGISNGLSQFPQTNVGHCLVLRYDHTISHAFEFIIY